jgi:hypothetical protein
MDRERLFGVPALLLFLVPLSAIAEDVYYPEYKRDPVPPVVVVEDLVHDDDGVQPGCNPANDSCEDPAIASSAVAISLDSRSNRENGSVQADGRLASRSAELRERVTADFR